MQLTLKEINHLRRNRELDIHFGPLVGRLWEILLGTAMNWQLIVLEWSRHGLGDSAGSHKQETKQSGEHADKENNIVVE
ncbi:hypothetical protein Tco_0520573 [Tanacetum coccineum]